MPPPKKEKPALPVSRFGCFPQNQQHTIAGLPGAKSQGLLDFGTFGRVFKSAKTLLYEIRDAARSIGATDWEHMTCDNRPIDLTRYMLLMIRA